MKRRTAPPDGEVAAALATCDQLLAAARRAGRDHVAQAVESCRRDVAEDQVVGPLSAIRLRAYAKQVG